MAVFPSSLTGSQRDAYAALVELFKSYGLETLAPQILRMIQEGYSSDTIALQLRETEEYKKRFSANEARRKAGLPVLSPQQYLDTENAYRQIMASAGLPVGFYDSQEDFQKFLEMDVSPTEIQARVSVVEDALNNADSNTLKYFNQYYTKGEIIAYALDPTRARPVIEKAYKASQIGGAGSAQGLSIDQQTAERLAGSGVTASQAQAGFGFIANEIPKINRLAEIYNQTDFTMSDLVSEVFDNNAAVGEKRKKLASQERATFSKSGAQTKTTLGKSNAGSL